jgi:hypothetical protein
MISVAAAARAMEKEAVNAHALGVANARMQSPIIWSVGGVAFVMVPASISLLWFMTSGQASRLTAASPRQRQIEFVTGDRYVPYSFSSYLNLTPG